MLNEKVYTTQIQYIKPKKINPKMIETINELLSLSKELYNTCIAIGNLDSKQSLSFIKNSKSYKMLPEIISDSIIDEVKRKITYNQLNEDDGWANTIIIKNKSFCGNKHIAKDFIINLNRKGESSIVLNQNFIQMMNNGISQIDIVVNERLMDKKKKNNKWFNEFRIFSNSENIYVEKFTSIETKKTIIDSDYCISIDPGKKNFITCLNSKTGESIIVGMERIKRIKKIFERKMKMLNKQKNHMNQLKYDILKSEFEKQKNEAIKQVLYIDALGLLNKCKKDNIGTIVFGFIDGIVSGSGSYVYQHKQLFKILEANSHLFGVKVIAVDESGTSKADFLANDPLPTEKFQKLTYSGYRVGRLYFSSVGKEISADVNAAGNIAKAGGFKVNLQDEKISKEILKNPRRISPTDSFWW